MKIVVQRTLKRVIKITPQVDGSVKIIAPINFSHKRIASIVRENLQWITDKLKCISANLIADTPKQDKIELTADVEYNMTSLSNADIAEMSAGKLLILQGHVYKVTPSACAQTTVQGDIVTIRESHFSDKGLRVKGLRSFLKKLCANLLTQEVVRFASAISRCPSKIQFKDLPNRWCDCASCEHGEVVLNFRLIQLPQELQRYVIAHAFVHFDCKGHDERFYNLLSNCLPQYKDCQRQLNDYSFLFDIL